MPPHRCELPAPSSSNWLLVPGPQWPYTVGAIASPVFGLSLLLFLTAVYLPDASGATLGRYGVLGGALAGVLLGIAWLGVLRDGKGGVGPMAGSFAFPLAVAYVYFQRGSHDPMTSAVLIIGSLAAFAWGNVAAPGNAVLRGLAAVSAMMWSFVFVAGVKQWDMPSALHALSLTALAVATVCLVFTFLELRDAPRRREP